jgi:hypothetical protein
MPLRVPERLRKNYLFVASPNGGEAAAVLYSLITSCKRLGINPWEYLKDIIDRISTHPMARVSELTPRGWKEVRERITPIQDEHQPQQN